MLKGNIICKMCGKCCYYEIPVTLFNIHNIARYLGITDQKAFQEYIQDKISSRSDLFMIQKNENGACIFLSDNHKCSIHQVKPSACQFYQCVFSLNRKYIPWTAYCTKHIWQIKLWEHSLSAKITKTYIQRNGTKWNEIEYHNAILSIQKNTEESYDKKIKLARDSQGIPMAMVYDCSKCERRGTVACETPVTIDDIKRICSHLKISIKAFFEQKISSEISQFTKGLKFIRHKHCIFYNEQTHCLIKDVRPLHCCFVPCPMRTKTSEMQERFYLGSGTVEEQFRHQVALKFTRQYVSECGTRYNAQVFDKLLVKIETTVSNSLELEKFCKRIAPYRYVDDALTILEPPEQFR